MAWDCLIGEPKERTKSDDLIDRFKDEVVNNPHNNSYVLDVTAFQNWAGKHYLIANIDQSRERPQGLVLWDVFDGTEVFYRPRYWNYYKLNKKDQEA